MYNGSDVVYEYDGSFEGMMTCVFESFEKKENPFGIYAEFAPANLFYSVKYIETHAEKANRVLKSIPVKISKEALQWVQLGFLSCCNEKEKLILDFLKLGYANGKKVTRMLYQDTVSALQKVVLHLTNESHLIKEFIRFSDYSGTLVSEIEPKNFVLPLIEQHFVGRYPNEQFLIYDRTYQAALIYRPFESKIVPIEKLELPNPDLDEVNYRKLWKRFYDTIAIKERENPRCRMSHMPKRYWNCMTEFQESGESLAEFPDKMQQSNRLING